jgi:hypothetical protein
MLTVLFWNLGGKSLADRVASLAEQHAVDLLILAECPVSPTDLLGILNRQPGAPFHGPDAGSLSRSLLVIPRFDPAHLKRENESAHYPCRHLCLPGRPALLLCALHLPSKLYQSAESQAFALPGLAERIRSLEQSLGHERTVLVGDFNMNPFETGLVSAQGLNAVMTREIALRGGREVEKVRYPFFYNPMWGHFRDATHEVHPPGTDEHRPPGTCYYPARESRWYYWNVFDQVLLRPALLPVFRNQDLRILVTDGTSSLLDARGLPDRKLASDHLPLLFQLDL